MEARRPKELPAVDDGATHPITNIGMRTSISPVVPKIDFQQLRVADVIKNYDQYVVKPGQAPQKRVIVHNKNAKPGRPTPNTSELMK